MDLRSIGDVQINVWVADNTVVKHSGCSNMGRARAKKLQFFCYPAYSLEEEVLLQTNGGKCAV